MGADPESFSGGAHCRWSSRTQSCEPPSLPICPQHNVSVLGTLVVEHWNLTIIRLSSIFMRAALLRSPMPELETSNVQAHMGRYAVWRIEAVDVAVFPSRAMPPAEMRLTDWGRDEAPKNNLNNSRNRTVRPTRVEVAIVPDQGHAPFATSPRGGDGRSCKAEASDLKPAYGNSCHRSERPTPAQAFQARSWH